MELEVTFDEGTVKVQVRGKSWADLEEGLEPFLSFLEENNERLQAIGLYGPQVSAGHPIGGAQGDHGDSRGEGDGNQGVGTGSPLSSLARKAKMSVDELEELIYVDPDREELPQVMAEMNKLGDNKVERQRTMAYIVLWVWQDCYGEERMKTSDLKEILSASGVSGHHLFKAWKGPGKGSFNPTGKGISATVGLTGPGKRRAMEKLQELAEGVEMVNGL